MRRTKKASGSVVNFEPFTEYSVRDRLSLAKELWVHAQTFQLLKFFLVPQGEDFVFEARLKMSIPKRLRAFEIEGRRIRTDRTLRRRDGNILAAGSILKIVDAHRNLALQSEVCPHCGQSFRITGVRREDVTFLSPQDSSVFKDDLIAVRKEELLAICEKLDLNPWLSEKEHRKNSLRAANELRSLIDSSASVSTTAKGNASQFENALAKLKKLLDEADHAVDTPEGEAVVEFGWQLFDIVKALTDAKDRGGKND